MDFRPTFLKKYVEGHFGGECAIFAENLVVPPTPNKLLGNSLMEKQNNLKNYGIPSLLLNQAFRLGDMVIFNIGIHGHVGIIAYIDWVHKVFYPAESNYHLDGLVHYTRAVSFSDSSIAGVLRGSFKFTPPAVQYPLHPKMAIIFNNQQPWQSMISELAKVQDWFFKITGGRLQLTIDNPYPTTNFQNIPTRAAGGGMGLITEVIEESWYEQNVIAQAPGHDIYIFILRPEDFKGQVYNSDNLIEIGYSYEPHFPIKTFVVLDQNSDYAPFYDDPDLQGLAKFICHEIVHGLYGIATGYNLPSGSDFTHNHFFGLNGYATNPNDIVADLNLDLIGWVTQQ